MRKLILGLGVGAAALLSASSALAATTVTFQGGSSTATSLPSNAQIVWDGDNTSKHQYNPTATTVFSNPDGNTGIASGSSSSAARPAFESTGNFGYVGPNGAVDFSFAAAQVFTFIIGSLDSDNSVTLYFAGDTAHTNGVTYTGSALKGLATGNQGSDQSNGRVTFDQGGGLGIIGATFRSGSIAFEFDNVATAAPEPATWLMMILGFGMVGAGLRRSRPARKLSLA